ncbi:MAG TPA: hypothetical protein VH392_05490 [Sphingomicrobium sp.]
MRMMTKILAGAAGFAAIAASAPAAAQYYPYGYSPYAYGGGMYGVNAGAAAQQCTAAVQNRLYNRTSLGTILGSLVGIPTAPTGRVLSVTQESRTRDGGMRIRGLATSGRYAYNDYGPYGAGAYGALGYGYNSAADLSFRCDVDPRGYIRDVDINRR